MSEYERELAVACAAARAASDAIRTHYERGGVVAVNKADDSPVTEADLEANGIILSMLGEAFPEDGVLSEESEPARARLQRRRIWIVDPLDGTRDFVARTGDFAVHVGLAVDGEAVLGVVAKPVGGDVYEAVVGAGARRWRGGVAQPLRVSTAEDLAAFRVAMTRLAVDEIVQRFVATAGLGANVVPMGASIKMMAVASGEVEVSLCLSDREKQWDTCAPEVIVREAGGSFTDGDGRPFAYDRADVVHRRGILVSNGVRHQELVRLIQPYLVPGAPAGGVQSP